MNPTLETIINVIVIILVLGIIITIHELGHFLMCRLTGIEVKEFSIGMGPAIFHWKKKETQYSIRLLPIGGYCLMLGEEEENCEDERAFPNKPLWVRMLVVLGGPIFNFLLAFVISLILIGMAGYMTGEINYVAEGSAAEAAGLKEGDIITRLDGSRIYDFREVSLYMQLRKSADPVDVEILRGDETLKYTITPQYYEEYGYYIIGINGGFHPDESGEYYVRTKANVATDITRSLLEVRYWIKATFMSLKALVTGKVGVNQVSGVVGVADVMNDTMKEAKADGGIYSVVLNVMNFVILISANLGVMNLLPIPALDGGRFLFLLAELIMRKPVPKDKEAMINVVGFVLLFVIMILVTFKDIRNLFV